MIVAHGGPDMVVAVRGDQLVKVPERLVAWVRGRERSHWLVGCQNRTTNVRSACAGAHYHYSALDGFTFACPAVHVACKLLEDGEAVPYALGEPTWDATKGRTKNPTAWHRSTRPKLAHACLDCGREFTTHTWVEADTQRLWWAHWAKRCPLCEAKAEVKKVEGLLAKKQEKVAKLAARLIKKGRL